jgi:hypothetical protein
MSRVKDFDITAGFFKDRTNPQISFASTFVDNQKFVTHKILLNVLLNEAHALRFVPREFMPRKL